MDGLTIKIVVKQRSVEKRRGRTRGKSKKNS